MTQGYDPCNHMPELLLKRFTLPDGIQSMGIKPGEVVTIGGIYENRTKEARDWDLIMESFSHPERFRMPDRLAGEPPCMQPADKQVP